MLPTTFANVVVAAKFKEHDDSDDLDKRAELKPYRNEYWRLVTNLDDAWAVDNDNFKAICGTAQKLSA